MLTNTTQYYSEGQGKKVAESVIYKIDKKQIKKKSIYTKYLGVLLDNQLSWGTT